MEKFYGFVTPEGVCLGVYKLTVTGETVTEQIWRDGDWVDIQPDLTGMLVVGRPELEELSESEAIRAIGLLEPVG